MASDIDLATSLFGNKRLETSTSPNVQIIQGTAVSDSADGKVKVVIQGDITKDTTEDDPGDNVVELETSPSVKEGDTVQITCNGGTAKQMTVTSVVSSGDRTQQSADDASKVATNYISIDENDGITVGNQTEGTLGKNAYIAANGFYIRDGETCLAHFEDDEISLGENSNSSIIKLCNDECYLSYDKDGGFYIYTPNDTPSEPHNTKLTLRAGYTTGTMEYRTNAIQLSKTGTKIETSSINRSSYSSEGSFFTQNSSSIELKSCWRTGIINPTEHITILKITPTKVTVDDTAVSLEGHTHTKSEITDFAHEHAKADITDFAHEHDAGDITSGVLPVERGGTGKTSGVMSETVLYSSASGTTADITLSESASNFEYIEIYYNYGCDNTAISPRFYTKIDTPNNKYVALQGSFRANSEVMQCLEETILISETQITRTTPQGWYLNAVVSNGSCAAGINSVNNFYIVKVVGIA